MADSDDEYDRRRRDKFRGERAGDVRSRRDDIYDRPPVARVRGDYRMDAYRSGGGGRDARAAYSPPTGGGAGAGHGGLSPPPHKRVRGDWSVGDRRYQSVYGGGETYAGHSNGSGGPGAGYSGSFSSYSESDGPVQPPMMTFKAFLASQDDMITDEDAIKKYTDYKLDFRRQQLSNFFLSHKEEEWFKAKYHPDECVKRQQQHSRDLQRRVDVFVELLSHVERVSLDGDNASAILRLLDTVVIRLENGTEADLAVLDMSDDEEALAGGSGGGAVRRAPSGDVKTASATNTAGTATTTTTTSITTTTKDIKDDNDEAKPFILDTCGKKPRVDAAKKADDLAEMMEMSEEQKKLQQKAKEFSKKNEESKKRKYGDSSGGSGSSSDSSSDSSDSSDSESEADGNGGGGGGGAVQPAPPGTENGSSTDAAGAAEKVAGAAEKTAGAAEKNNSGGDKADGETKVSPKKSPLLPLPYSDAKKPRPLHKTSSIFLRNLAPTITKQEVEAMCRRYPGFLRAAIADPQSDRRWFRRGWVTFQRHVNIKEICWNLNNIRLRDCELGAIVNRDLSRRVRTVSGLTSDRTVVRADVKLAARIIQNLDERHCLWHATQDAALPTPSGEDTTAQQDDQQLYEFSSLNPVLRKITDYLIEEASAEEDELMGVCISSAHTGSDQAPPSDTADQQTTKSGDSASTETVDRDEELIKVLDKLLLYLRIVHSIDYYNHSEYPNEDDMPNRCGIIHTRGIPPSSKVTADELQDYISTFKNKIGSFHQPIPRLDDAECKKQGLVLKIADDETEKFVQANTQELSTDKWLCPLSNKKFKGPDFVRKHIFNKHSEKIDEVKKEVEFFNNYLRDPKRPQLPEHPSSRAAGRKDTGASSSSAAGHFHGGGYPPPAPPPGHHAGYSGYGYQRSGAGAYSGSAGGYHHHHQAASSGAVRDPYYREPYLPPRDAYPRPPRPHGRRDPRGLVAYNDLDAPVSSELF